MFIADSHFCIGQSHWVCQDYTLHGQRPFPFAMVADGCSASLNSDIGARLLVHAALQHLQDLCSDIPAHTHWPVGELIVQTAWHAAQTSQLDMTALDATLWIVAYHNQRLRVHGYGDGGVVHRWKDDMAFYQADWYGNAPYYLSYRLDDRRHQLYEEAVGEQPLTLSTHGNAMTQPSQESLARDYPLIWEFDPHHTDVLAALSDGVSSVRNRRRMTRVDPRQIADQWTRYPNLVSGFARYQLMQSMIDLNRQQLDTLDDASVAALARDREAMSDTWPFARVADLATQPRQTDV